MRRYSTTILMLGLLVANGCGRGPVDLNGDGGTGSLGGEGEACFPNQTCDPGLHCQTGKCSRLDGGLPDRFLRFDVALLPDSHGPLQPCDRPGEACDPEDPCVVSAACSADGLCHPLKLQNCDDGLDCTTDTCQGQGLCEHVPGPGTCVLLVASGNTKTLQCLPAGTVNPDNPCQICQPDQRPEQWSPSNGQPCDDHEPCTKDDVCQQGQCAGTYFGHLCDDQQNCTEDVCDGTGGCQNTLSKDFCLIEGQCYANGQPSSSVCASCEVSTSQTSWTPLSAPHCTINGICYKDGAINPTASCQRCDLSQSATSWTLSSGNCAIDGTCYSNGAINPTASCQRCDLSQSATSWTLSPDTCYIEDDCHSKGDPSPNGCGICDSVANPLSWTALAGKCLLGQACVDDQTLESSGCLICDVGTNPKGWTPLPAVSSTSTSFDEGKNPPTDWSFNNKPGSPVGWVVVQKRTWSGQYALYYGNPATWNYNDGDTNSGTATLPPIALTAGKKAALSFMLWMDTEASDAWDKLQVVVNGQVLWQKGNNTVMKAWQAVIVNLDAFAGQTPSIQLVFDTDDDTFNETEGVFIDDVLIYHGC